MWRACGPSYREAKGGAFDFFSSQTPSEHNPRHPPAPRRQWRSTCGRSEVCPSPRRSKPVPILRVGALWQHAAETVGFEAILPKSLSVSLAANSLFWNILRKPKNAKSLFLNTLHLSHYPLILCAKTGGGGHPPKKSAFPPRFSLLSCKFPLPPWILKTLHHEYKPLFLRSVSTGNRLPSRSGP